MANILVVGKDLPESENLIKSFELQGHKVFTTANSDFSIDSESIFAFSWNKASSISAKTLLVQAESKLQQIDRVLIIFDGPAYSTKFESDRIEDCTQAVEHMISSYIYFCQTLVSRLAQKPHKVTIGFYLKNVATKADLATTKSGTQTPCSNCVSTAQGAFLSMAENFGITFYQLDQVSVFLCQSDISNELYTNEKDTGAWILSYFDAEDNLKQRQSAKQSLSWVKVGGKMPGSFSLFK
ncbi:MAG: hypothetical protein HUK25_03200 [Treponema sp.]|nr:hypothetical protein [Treponema sp.]